MTQIEETQIGPEEDIFLRYAARPNASWTATYWFASKLGEPQRNARRAYIVMRGLVRRGLMEGQKGVAGRIYWYRITEAGRCAIEEARQL